MSSLLRYTKQASGPDTKFFDLFTPAYVNGTLQTLPIPFIVTNQTLDINIAQDIDIQNFVTSGTDPVSDVSFLVKNMGGFEPINSLGPNMITWLRYWIGAIEDPFVSPVVPYTGPLNIYINPVMMKIQVAEPGIAGTNHVPLGRDEVVRYTNLPPTSSEYVGGEFINDYYSSWVFKTPLTIQYISPIILPGLPRYITLRSEFSE